MSDILPNITFKGFGKYVEMRDCCSPIHAYLQSNTLAHNHSVTLDIIPRKGPPFQINLMQQNNTFTVVRINTKPPILPEITFTNFDAYIAIGATCIAVWNYSFTHNNTQTLQLWPRGWYPFEIEISHTETGGILANFVKNLSVYEYKNPAS